MLPTIRSNLSMFVFLLVVSCGAGRPLCRAAEKLPYNLELLRTFVPPPDDLGAFQEVFQVGFTKNGRQIACAASGGVYIWDTKTGGHAEAADPYPPSGATGLPRRVFCDRPLRARALWPATGLDVQDDLAVSKTSPIRLKLLQPGVVEMVTMVNFPIEGEGSFRMGRVFFSADGEYLAALRFDKSINVWKVRGGERRGTLRRAGKIRGRRDFRREIGVVRSDRPLPRDSGCGGFGACGDHLGLKDRAEDTAYARKGI